MKAAFLLLLGAASALFVSPPIQNNGRDRAMRIVGGHEVTDRTEFPFFVRIVMDDPIGHMYCGGTLLSNQHVLTAAQCTYHHSYFYLGFGTIIFSIPATTVGTSRKMEHHLYSPVDWNYDIALITMDYTESNEFIQPAQLPRRFQDGDYWNYGMVRIAGFGSTSETGSRPDYLHATTLQVIPNEECEEVYGSVVESWHICCHGFEEQGSSPCYVSLVF